ncbi:MULTISPECIES: hypothetical protein [unclassified Frankia]|nr:MULTISPECIES: hypothetical protein [unclassified Frankia]
MVELRPRGHHAAGDVEVDIAFGDADAQPRVDLVVVLFAVETRA